MPKQPTKKTGKPSKARPPKKASEAGEPQPSRPFVYTGPPLPEDQQQKLREALSKLPRLPELDRSILSKLDHAPVRKQRKPATTREGARLLSQDQKDRGTAHLDEKLNDPKEKNPRRWRLQNRAAENITRFLGLPEESAQTVEDQIVIPVFDRRGLRKPKK